jgi:hypothetical protein
MALSTGARCIQSAVVLAESDEDQVRVDLRKKPKDDVTDSFSRIQVWRHKNAEQTGAPDKKWLRHFLHVILDVCAGHGTGLVG